MYKSIQYFNEKCAKRFENLEDEFIKEPTDIASYVLKLTDELHYLGVQMIKETLERSYLLDKLLGLETGERMTDDAEAMAQLRAYYYNHGDMLELVRYQKEELPKAAGNEGSFYSITDIMSSEK